MKTIILGMLGATMFGSVAQAACNDIPNPTRFNPQSLSAYQECWLDHYEEDDAGVLGSLAWIRINGNYFSAPISLIRKMKGTDYADKFFNAISDDLIEVAEKETQEQIEEIETVIEYIEVIIKDTTRISELEAQVASLEVAKAALESTNTELNDTITTLNGTITDLNNQISAIWSGVQATQAHMTTTYGEDWEYDSITNNSQLQSWLVEMADMHASDLATAQTLATQAAAATAEAQKEVQSLKEKIATAKAQSNTATAHSTNTINNSALALAGESEEWYDVDIPALGLILTAQAGTNNIVDVTVSGTTKTFVKVDSSWIEADGDMDTSINLVSQLNTLTQTQKNAINSKLDAAYDEGYADGYNDGYADGYADGVADTKAHLN